MKDIVLFKSVPLQERINFARHLHLMIKTGLSLVDLHIDIILQNRPET